LVVTIRKKKLKMKKLILASAFHLFLTGYAYSQGCSPLRNVAGVSPDIVFKNSESANKTYLNITNRYLEGSSSYKGTKFLTDTLVTNRINTFNISLIKLLDNGWSLALNIPISADSRRNSADHGGLKTPKHTTSSFGIGDLRFAVYKWLFNTTTHKTWNIQTGLGIKLPSGDYKYQDYFYRNDSTKVLAPVDVAIQLGDGGSGITGELNGFYSFSRALNIYFNGYYLMNPREQNGVSNLKGRNATQLEISNNTTVMSVPDQYSCRIGANVQIEKIILAGGIRYERLPENDLVGGNKGFRRASSISSVEPGITYLMKKSFAFVYVGIPFQRNIVQNHQNNMTPAGFADFVFSFGAQLEL
jgi:hypothetical protein